MFQKTPNGFILDFKVKTKRRETLVTSYDKEEIEMDVSEKKENNKANESMLRYLSKLFDISKEKIKIVSGKTSEKKKIFFEKNYEENEVIRILEKKIEKK